jgi:hypothetical protein
VEQARKALGHCQSPVILILDGFNAHHIDAFISEAIGQNIYPIILVPHSNDQCQPLDLVASGNMKRFISTAEIRYSLSNQSQKIVNMLGAWHQAMTPHLVVSAFIARGLIIFMCGDGLVYMRATQIRSWVGQGLHPLDVWEGGNRRIRQLTEQKALLLYLPLERMLNSRIDSQFSKGNSRKLNG